MKTCALSSHSALCDLCVCRHGPWHGPCVHSQHNYLHSIIFTHVFTHVHVPCHLFVTSAICALRRAGAATGRAHGARPRPRATGPAHTHTRRRRPRRTRRSTRCARCGPPCLRVPLRVRRHIIVIRIFFAFCFCNSGNQFATRISHDGLPLRYRLSSSRGVGTDYGDRCTS